MVLIVWLVLIGIAHADTPRSAATVAAFRKTHPCPSTGRITGACPGYVADHSYPLCAGGTDSPENLVWQTRAQSYFKDRIERELCACKAKLAVPK